MVMAQYNVTEFEKSSRVFGTILKQAIRRTIEVDHNLVYMHAYTFSMEHRKHLYRPIASYISIT
jgi:hypothetical protein